MQSAKLTEDHMYLVYSSFNASYLVELNANHISLVYIFEHFVYLFLIIIFYIAPQSRHWKESHYEVNNYCVEIPC